MRKTSTHLAFSVLKWFEKVRGGSLRLNHPENGYFPATYLVDKSLGGRAVQVKRDSLVGESLSVHPNGYFHAIYSAAIVS